MPSEIKKFIKNLSDSLLLQFIIFVSLTSRIHAQECSNIYIEPYPIRNFTTNGSVYDITSADFNLDGFKDIAVAELGASTVSILINNTDSTDIFCGSGRLRDFRGSDISQRGPGTVHQQ